MKVQGVWTEVACETLLRLTFNNRRVTQLSELKTAYNQSYMFGLGLQNSRLWSQKNLVPWYRWNDQKHNGELYTMPGSRNQCQKALHQYRDAWAIVYIYRDYFTVGEYLRFLFTSCDGLPKKRVSAAKESVLRSIRTSR